MGAHYKYGPYIGTEQQIEVEKFILHPSFHKPKSFAHDIALIKLKRPAILTKAVGLACLPSDEVAGFVPGKSCWITGKRNVIKTRCSGFCHVNLLCWIE